MEKAKYVTAPERQYMRRGYGMAADESNIGEENLFLTRDYFKSRKEDDPNSSSEVHRFETGWGIKQKGNKKKRRFENIDIVDLRWGDK